MIDYQRRLLDRDILSKIPPGVNPFKYLLDLAGPALAYSLTSNSTQYILWVLMVLHWLTVLFNLGILLLLYKRGGKQFLWLVRRLEIGDKNGKNAPLFLFNAGAVIPIMQCAESLAAQGYIFLVIKNATFVYNRASHLDHSSHFDPASHYDSATYNAFTTMMIIMFSCEILNYWALSHTFLVAIYSCDRIGTDHDSTGARRWVPSPTLINAVFLIFAIGVVTACMTLFTWFSPILNHFLAEVFSILKTLQEGSSIWDQLRISSTPTQEKYQLVTNLTQVVSRAERLGQNLKTDLRKTVNSLAVVQLVLLALITIASVVFVLVFCKLARRFHEQAKQSRLSSVIQPSSSQLQRMHSQEDLPSTIQQISIHTNRTFIDTVRSNRQFLYLIIRAGFIGIAMLTTMTELTLGIWANDRVTNSQLRHLLTWLATASGTWSAVPISWHCWRLYKDQSGGALLTSSASKSNEVALTVYPSNAPPEEPSEPVTLNLNEIKIERGFNTGNLLNFSKALEDLPNSRGSLTDSLKNFSS